MFLAEAKDDLSYYDKGYFVGFKVGVVLGALVASGLVYFVMR